MPDDKRLPSRPITFTTALGAVTKPDTGYVYTAPGRDLDAFPTACGTECNGGEGRAALTVARETANLGPLGDSENSF